MLSKQQVRERVALKGGRALAISLISTEHEKTETQGAKGTGPKILIHTEDVDIMNLLYTCAGDAFSHFFLTSTLERREICLSVAILSFPPEGGREGHEIERHNSPKWGRKCWMC